VVGFFVTGFFLTEELTAVALQRRGVQLRERLALLRSRKLLVWGFGTPLGLSFLVPFVAVFLMPGAVAGATLLARELLGEETGEETGGDEGDDEENGGSATSFPQPPAGSPAPGR
jgi:CysZ protein